jgi:hypothetical protein
MAGAVKGSKQLRMTVVPYRPWLRAAVLGSVVILCVFGGLATYWIGYQRGAENLAELGFAYSLEVSDRERIALELAELRSQLAVLDRTRLVDQQVNEQAQSTITELRNLISALERDVTLYRQVMALENAAAELSINTWELFAAEVPHHYRYRLMLSQYGGGGASVEGRLEIALEGLLDDAVTYIPLSDVSNSIESNYIPINFRYLHSLEGDLVLPVDFKPQKIHIQIHAGQPANRLLRQAIDWILTGEY